MAHDGLARAIYPVHTPLDGDIVFAASTGKRPLADPVHGLAELGTVAANVLARADRARRLRGDGAALPARAAELEGQVLALACDFQPMIVLMLRDFFGLDNRLRLVQTLLA